MAKLVLTLEGSVLDEYPLSGKRLTIGRARDNDIQLEHAAVSNHHAQIGIIKGEYTLEDSISTNGTFVNGEKVVSHTLEEGDVIAIADFQMKFVGAGDTVPAEGAEGPRLLSDEEGAQTVYMRAPAKRPAAPAEEEQPKKGGNMALILALLAVAAIIAGGAVALFMK